MINLQLTIEQVNAILGHLGRLPYEQVSTLIAEIMQQGVPQAKALEESQNGGKVDSESNQ